MPISKRNENVLIGLTLIGSILLIRKIIRMNTKKLSRNFDWSEFESHDGAIMPESAKNNIKELVKNLEVIRTASGNKPIRINSGYRSPQQNANVNGKSKSYHLQGMAADFVIVGMTTKQTRDLIENLIAAGKIKQGGIGNYPTWVHYDIRGTKARW
jgi:uncharacterized protein YcbK (DUF882 family)